METTKSSNTLHTFSYPQLQYTPPYLSLTTDSDNFQCNVPSKASSFDVPSAPKEHHSFQMSGSDSCSEEGGDATDVEEVSLDELLNDAKAKKKLEQLAAIVGVDTTEPAIVLTEVVRVLKLFNHYYTTT
ncbi:unnamed protein product [Sphenostylis stenocarpa]|uniref:Uncharacterized protein n=1 Tax=Sphenostylis stenocarpa TaxID=92480 RepID=A0AA86VEA6_9FABA|nr:unnamed protein product [Sphenostylis stenocarpa]